MDIHFASSNLANVLALVLVLLLMLPVFLAVRIRRGGW